MQNVINWIQTCVLVGMLAWAPASGAAAPASEAAGPASGALGPLVEIEVAQPQFRGLAERVASETRTLLAPENDPWTVVVAADEETAARAETDDAPDPRVRVRVRVGPSSPGAARPDSYEITLDPLGLEEPAARRIAAAPLARRSARDLEALGALLRALDLAPDAVAVPVLESTDARQREALAGAAAKSGLTVGLSDLPAGFGAGEMAAAADRLNGRVVYLPAGLGDLAAPFAAALTERGALTFSALSPEDGGRGALAARSGAEWDLLARLTALEVLAEVRSLGPPAGGEDPAPALAEARGRRLALDLDAAARLDLDLPWQLVLSSRVYGEPRRSGRPATLEGVRAEAVSANVDRLARELATAASRTEIETALAALRPRLTVGVRGSLIDEDSAAAAFGAQPERLVSAVGEASWVLFSEDARAAVEITRLSQAARELEIDQVELDLALNASVLLLEVARARAFEIIDRENLERSYADLAAARSRRAVGAGGRGDVARLEARAAQDTSALALSYGARRSLEIQLNRLLSRPLGEELLPVIEGSDQPLEESPRLLALGDLVRRRGGSAGLRAELLERAVGAAPELAAADRIVAARERELEASRRAFLWPALAATGGVSTRLADGGTGLRPPELPPDLAVGEGFPNTPDTSWNLGLGASLEVFSGGAKSARRARAELELESARALRRSAEERVRERVDLALVGLETALEAAAQARRAALAAAEAYEVTREGYRQGAVRLTALLDSQSQLLEARQRATTAEYGARARWLEAQRAAGAFLTPEESDFLLAEARSPAGAAPAEEPLP